MVRNPELSRYEAWLDGKVAGFVEYRIRPDAIALTHAEVDPAYGGQGVGSALARGVLDQLRESGHLVVPACPFIVHFIREHQEYTDLVVPRAQAELADG